MGLSWSSNPEASDEAWFPHKSCHDIHYSAGHRASLPQPPVHFRWTTLRLRATQHNANVTLPRSGNQKRALRNIFALIHPKALTELPCINSCINGRYYWPMLNSDYNCILVRKFPGPKIDPKIGHSFLPSQAHCGLCINGMPLATLWLPGQCWLPISTVSCPHHNKARNLIKYP